MYALVDCNNFFASCQRVFEPHLIGKPIVVLSNNDGCVIARSNEAKALGIPMGAPAFKYKNTFKEKNIHVYSSNYALYGDMSSRVMNLLATYTPEIEIYSIDEAFLKLDGFEHIDLQDYGIKIQRAITKGTGIPISVGIAPTKTLAKIANHIAKKFPERTQNVHLIDSTEKRIKALKWTKIEDVWGVGRRHAKRLLQKDITTAHQFTLLPDQWVQNAMSIIGLNMKHELEGVPKIKLEQSTSKKSIATTRTFEASYTDLDTIAERISTFTASCAEKLRQQNSLCQMVLVFLRTNRHHKKQTQYSRNIIINTHFPTSSTIELNQYAQQGLKTIYKEGYQYKRAGIVLLGLSNANETQLNLFEKSHPKHQPLMSVVDRLNKNIGNNKVRFGNQSLGRQWKMKQEHLSPNYSTDIKEIIEIKL